MTSKYMQI